MKKAIAIILATAALMASVSTAQAQDKWFFNHLGIGVSAGLDGFGADLVLPLTPFFQLRGGYAMQPVTYTIPKSVHIEMSKANGDVWNLNQDVTATVAANLDAAHLFLDIYPGKKTGFHLTVGAYYGINPEKGGPYYLVTNPLEIDESDKGSVGINLDNGGKLTTDKEGKLMAGLALENPLAGRIAGLPANLYPYAGIGFGRNLSSRRVAFTMDLGAIYTGRLGLTGYDYSRTETVGVQNTPIYATDLNALDGLIDGETLAKIQSIYGKVEKCPVTPVLKFNLVFRLF